jgi:hypothetical protein
MLLALPLMISLFLPLQLFAAGGTVSGGELVNPIGGTKDNPRGISREAVKDKDVTAPINELAARVIKSALGLVGSLTLLVFIYGGFMWLTSAGSAEQVKKGWHAMIYSALGLFIVFGAYAILSLVIKGLTGK